MNECFGDYHTKIDTVTLSGFKTKRLFGINCGLVVCDEEGNEEDIDPEIAGYSIKMITKVGESNYFLIEASYFSDDKKELTSIENDLISFIDEIKFIRK